MRRTPQNGDVNEVVERLKQIELLLSELIGLHHADRIRRDSTPPHMTQVERRTKGSN